MLKATVDHVGDGFEPPMWMPRCAFGLTGRIVHRAHLVHVHERIKQLAWHPGEGTVDRKTFAFKAGRRGGDTQHRTLEASRGGPSSRGNRR